MDMHKLHISKLLPQYPQGASSILSQSAKLKIFWFFNQTTHVDENGDLVFHSPPEAYPKLPYFKNYLRSIFAPEWLVVVNQFEMQDPKLEDLLLEVERCEGIYINYNEQTRQLQFQGNAFARDEFLKRKMKYLHLSIYRFWDTENRWELVEGHLLDAISAKFLTQDVVTISIPGENNVQVDFANLKIFDLLSFSHQIRVFLSVNPSFTWTPIKQKMGAILPTPTPPPNPTPIPQAIGLLPSKQFVPQTTPQLSTPSHEPFAQSGIKAQTPAILDTPPAKGFEGGSPQKLYEQPNTSTQSTVPQNESQILETPTSSGGKSSSPNSNRKGTPSKENPSNESGVKSKTPPKHEQSMRIPRNNLPPLSMFHQFPSLDGRNLTFRRVVLDGSNVASFHGDGKKFSAQGIKLAIEFFRRANVRAQATVPEMRMKPHNHILPLYDPDRLLQEMDKNKDLIITPERTYEDHFVVDSARSRNAVIISNDTFKDLIQPELKSYIQRNRFPFIVNQSTFIVAREVGKKQLFEHAIIGVK